MAFLADAMIQPRVCGDYRMKRGIKKRFLDTTPRVRGLPEPQVRPASPYRYNPACAGTTPALPQTAPHNPIQPRVCGDYAKSIWTLLPSGDTTPRVRGLHPNLYIWREYSRYNPACAGTTPFANILFSAIPIQPRVCGDYCVRFKSRNVLTDTTPRVRGLHQRISGTRAILS